MTDTIFTTTLHQMILFGLILCAGFIAAKLKVITQESMLALSRLIVNLLLPALIFSSTYTDATKEALLEDLPMLALTAGFYLLISLITYALARAVGLLGDKARVFQLCFIFGNTGFVGFPLVATVFPENGFIYMALFTVVDQLIFWTYGIYLSTSQEPVEDTTRELPAGHEVRRHTFAWRSLISPNTVTMVIAFALVMLSVPLPELLTNAIGIISSATPALCMIYLGALVCFSNWADVLKQLSLYAGILVKMVAVPILLAKALTWWGVFPTEMVQCFTMIAALPTMTVVPIVASKNGHFGDYAAGVTVVTLVVSIATIPLVIALSF
ncbi:MAG: hypothetical protein HFJ65_05310 [Eggerthellaceae bacterium]|nr:hypothetical protein [Eggerthellaceae bacterium]